MFGRGGRQGIGSIAAACAAIVLPLSFAQAQSTPRRSVDLPAQPLGMALTELARQANREIYFSSDLTAGKRTGRLHGHLSVDEALRRLLAGSGLEYRVTAAGSIVLGLAAPKRTPSPAVDTASTDAPDMRVYEDIIVTGSRLARTSFNSPTPVNIVDRERMQALGISNVGDALNQLPAFRPLTTPATNSFRPSQNIAARTLDLRGLGAARTLTLVDGRRMVPSADDNTFDLNAIPSILVRRAEVVTGGASAAYGADAVAGVVNLVLDRDLTGLRSELSYGLSGYSDARTFYGAVTGGTGFADGRGHLVAALEYVDEGGVRDFNQRDWSRRYRNLIPNPFFSTDPAQSNGLPATIAIDNVLYVLNPGGLISVTHPLQSRQFDASGNLVPFRFGDLFNPARPSTLMVGGDPSVEDVYGFNNTPLVVPTNHVSALAKARLELSDRVGASATVSFARVLGGPTSGSFRADQLGAIRIGRDNAFLSPATAALMDAVGTNFLPISRSNVELGGSDYRSRNFTWRASLAVQGAIGSTWHWDALYGYDRTSGRLSGSHQRIEQRWRDALDAVRSPGGAIVCRSTLADPGDGCVPVDIMGPNKISAAAANWVLATTFQTRIFTQHNLGLNLRGTVAEGRGGPIALAGGLEYRANSSRGDADANSKAGAFTTVSASYLPPSTQEVREAYAEISVPLFKDASFGRSLEIDAAVRRTAYSLSGNATTWKFGAAYEIDGEIMLRLTRSRDIRAPSPQELNPNTRVLVSTQGDTKYGIQYPIRIVTGGNARLQLERANTFTIGTVLKPSWAPRLQFSVDYYDIRVSGAIDAIGIPLAVNLCRAVSHPTICTVGNDGNGNPDRILEVRATYENLNQLRARGLEFVTSYTRDISGGAVTMALNGNYVDRLSTTLPDGSRTEYSGVTGNPGSVTALFGVPKWLADLVMGYAAPRYSVTTQFRYIPQGTLRRDWIGPQDDGYSPYLPNSVSNNRIGAAFYVNISLRAQLTGGNPPRIEAFGTINNLLDSDPPSNLRLSGNPVYFDPVGRSFKFGIRAEW